MSEHNSVNRLLIRQLLFRVRFLPKKSDAAHLISGGSVPAVDAIEITSTFPTSRCGIDTAMLLRTLTFNDGDNTLAPSVFHLAVLLQSIAIQYGKYRMYNTMCYWHAAMTYEVFKLCYPTCSTESLSLDINWKGTYLNFTLLDDHLQFQYGGLSRILKDTGITVPSNDSQILSFAKQHDIILQVAISPDEFNSRYFAPALEQARVEVEEQTLASETHLQAVSFSFS